MVNDGDIWSGIRGRESAKRAFVVAAVQKHSVLLYGGNGTGKDTLVKAGAELGLCVGQVLPCPCGNYSLARRACQCTPEELWRHVNAVVRCTAAGYDIHVELPEIPARELLSERSGTSLAAAREQLARRGPLPPDVLGNDAKTLLILAVNELGLGIGEVVAIRAVARSIASLGHHDQVQVDDVAEAVSYRLRCR